MFCFLTLLALSLPQFPSLDIGPVALPSFLRGKKQSSLPFLGQLLSLVTYLLYGKVRSGFYPAKASTGASKLTAQLRCACLEVWECAFPLFFKANSVFDVLKQLCVLEVRSVRFSCCIERIHSAERLFLLAQRPH